MGPRASSNVSRPTARRPSASRAEKLFAHLVEPRGGPGGPRPGHRRRRADPPGGAGRPARVRKRWPTSRPVCRSCSVTPATRSSTSGVASSAQLIVQLIESPQFRLAGAEEAIRHVIASFQKAAGAPGAAGPRPDEPGRRGPRAHSEPGHPAEEAARQREGSAAAARGAGALAGLCPSWRYQSLVLQQVTRGLVSLRGLLSDELREVNFCRARLTELAQAFEETGDD